MKLGDLQGELKKKHGDKFITKASEVAAIERLPTGIYQFDHATGGGFPRGKLSLLYGAESSGKTNMALKAIAMNQLLEPDKKNVFVDIEHSFDPIWASHVGVNVTDLVLFKPDYGEQAVDIIQSIMTAEDVGVVVIDSIAALTPVNEDESTAEKAQVGGNALLISKMMKKLILELSRASRKDSFPTVIAINQLRTKIGVMFGNPETQPGGQSLKHVSGLTVRLNGKNIIDKTIDSEQPAFKFMKGRLKKIKIQVLSEEFDFNFPVLNTGGIKVGVVKAWKTMQAHLKDLGWLYKDGKWVYCLDMKFSTFKEVEIYFSKKPEMILQLQKNIIDYKLESKYGVEEEDD